MTETLERGTLAKPDEVGKDMTDQDNPFDEDEMLGIEKISNNITDSIALLVDKKLDLFSSTVNNK